MGPELLFNVINFRLEREPSDGLLSILPSIQRSVIESKAFLQSEQINTKGTAASVVFDRFKKILTTFLTDNKDWKRRFTATVLISAAIGAGSPQILGSSAGWIRGLLGILGKWQDPPETKKIALVALVKIFKRTHDFPTLVRELTTPNLPAFIKACLQNIVLETKSVPTFRQLNTQQMLLPPVFDAFSHLIPRHPAVFRSFEKQLMDILVPLIFPASVENLKPGLPDCLAYIIDDSHWNRLLSILHFTAPKNTGPQQWNNNVETVIREMHAVTDHVYRSIHEDWESSTGIQNTLTGLKAYEGQPGQGATTFLGRTVSGWKDLHQGTERLRSLLSLLQHHITTETSSQVSFPLGRIADLLVRLLLTTTPNPKDPQTNQKTNENCPQSERQELWSHLPSIHVSAFELIKALSDRLGSQLKPLAVLLFDHVRWVISREPFSDTVRNTAYEAAAFLLPLCGRSFTLEQVRSLDDIVTLACEDILPCSTQPTQPPKQNGTNNMSSVLSSTHSTQSLPTEAETTAPRSLLTAILTHILSTQIPTALRTKIDRTIVLGSDKAAMQASIVNPPSSIRSADAKVRSSLVPFLARQYGGDVDVEFGLRPRLPVMVTTTEVNDGDDGGGEGVDDMNGRYESLADTWGPREDVMERRENVVDDGFHGLGAVDPNRESLTDAWLPREDVANRRLGSSIHLKEVELGEEAEAAEEENEEEEASEAQVFGYMRASEDDNPAHPRKRSAEAEATAPQPPMPVKRQKLSPPGPVVQMDAAKEGSDSEGEMSIPELVLKSDEEDEEGEGEEEEE